MLNSLLVSISIIFAIISFISLVKTEICFKRKLEKERMISEFSEDRMKLIKMVNAGEINPHSSFFKYIFSSTSFSIRALFFYENKEEALKHISVLKEISPHILNDSIKDEIQDLNYEQKQLFVRVTLNVLTLYLDFHLIELILFNLMKTNSKKKKKKKVARQIEYPQKLYNYSCFCPA